MSLGSIVPKFAVVFAIFIIIILSFFYIQDNAKTEVMNEQKIEQIEQELIIRKEVNDILEENRISNPDRDGAIALERLRERYRNSESN